MINSKILENAKLTIDTLTKSGLKIALAESCTGGLLAACITSIPGSSQVFERGFVTYSNKSKTDLLTVPTIYFQKFGAVSKETAIAMAEGALLMSEADIALSITGIAGPNSDDSNKPIGTIHIALSKTGLTTKSFIESFEGNRNEIRNQTVEKSLGIILSNI